jgi:hypothetical protein
MAGLVWASCKGALNLVHVANLMGMQQVAGRMMNIVE